MQKNQRKNQQTNEQEKEIRRNGGNREETESSSRSWKEIVDEKLQRLHSLQFGAEEALENGDGETSLMLNLCLLGFLESQCSTAEDRILASPIIHQTKQRIDACRDKISVSVDRDTLEQVNCKESTIFKKSRGIDLEKILKSKYFLPHMDTKAQDATLSPNKLVVQTEKCTRESTSQGNCVPANKTSKEKPLRVDFQDDNGTKTCKNLTQSKLTSLYLNGNLKPPIISSKKHVNLPQKQSTQDDHHTINSHNSRTHSVGSLTVTSMPGCGGEEDERHYGTAVKRQKASHHDEAPCINNRNEISNAVDAKDLDNRAPGFVTAKQKWAMDSTQKRGGANAQNQWSQPTSPAYGGPTASSYHTSTNGNRNVVPKSLGMNRRGVRGNFIPPVRSGSGGGGGGATSYNAGSEAGLEDSTRRCLELLAGPDGELPDKLKNVEPKLIEHISNEIMDQDPNVRWDDIAGLEHAKKCVTEMVIWPLLRPDIFQGCRSPGKGLLLFGPPGTGKTMIGKAIAGEAKATFFSISASSLTSKWIGEGEKLVRALFGVASCRQPAVIFIDEIDSLLSQRKSDGEHESSRRLKTQFLIEMEGCGSGIDQLLLIGATNRPQELDEAARRRLSKRLYIPLPSAEARSWIVSNLLKKDGLFTLSEDDIHKICDDTEGYSGSDMSNLVKEASMGPLREALMQGIDINKLRKEEMRPVMLQDFKNAVLHVKPSVSQTELSIYEDWNRQFGSHSL